MDTHTILVEDIFLGERKVERKKSVERS